MHLPIYPLPSPHCRYVMDRWGFPTTWAATVGLGVLWSLLLLYDAEGTLLPSFVCYALFRTFLFTFLFAYIADTLGFRCAPLSSRHPLLFALSLRPLTSPPPFTHPHPSRASGISACWQA